MFLHQYVPASSAAVSILLRIGMNSFRLSFTKSSKLSAVREECGDKALKNLRTKTASDCFASKPCLLASTVNVSDRSEKSPAYLRLLPIFLIQGLDALGAQGRSVAALLAWCQSLSQPIAPTVPFPNIFPAIRHPSPLPLIKNLDTLGAEMRVRRLGRLVLGRLVVRFRACGGLEIALGRALPHRHR